MCGRFWYDFVWLYQVELFYRKVCGAFKGNTNWRIIPTEEISGQIFRNIKLVYKRFVEGEIQLRG